MIDIIKYEKGLHNEWNEFVDRSKNATFLFNRNYMGYHSDRFTDHSLMIYYKNKLMALFPANIKERYLYSHGGLTYGGFIITDKINTPLMLKIFEEMKNYCSGKGIQKIVYKSIPHIYHKKPAEEDLYALYVNKASLVKRDVSSTVCLRNFKINNNKQNGVRKAEKSGLIVEQCDEVKAFWVLVNLRLHEKYRVNSVHTADEMKILMDRFQNNIKLFCAKLNNEILGGALIYETDTVAHAQYLATNEEGREKRALDLIISFLLNDYYKNKLWFDFGISTEQQGYYLNESLIKQKEEYGASAVNYDTYELSCMV